MTILNDIYEIMVDVDNKQQAMALVKKFSNQANINKANQLEQKQRLLNQKLAGRQLMNAKKLEMKNPQMQRMHKQLGI